MSATAEVSIEPGLPVEVGKIDKELGKLWEETGDTKTRASLINLAIYTEERGFGFGKYQFDRPNRQPARLPRSPHLRQPWSLERASQRVDQRPLPSRGKGRASNLSEQITFQLDGGMVSALPNIVFSHLDSDLPLYFWWQENFREPLDEKLWGVGRSPDL